MSVSAWESYVEELMRESVLALRPPGPALGLWPSLNANVMSLLGRFNTPNSENVERLIENCIGLPNIRASWRWQNCTTAQARSQSLKGLPLRQAAASLKVLTDDRGRYGRASHKQVWTDVHEILSSEQRQLWNAMRGPMPESVRPALKAFEGELD